MKCIPSYCIKRNNSMLGRITWNVFFVHWVACGKYRLIPLFASCNSKPTLPMSAWDPWRDGPFPAILQVMWQLDLLWLANWPSFRGQSCSRNREKAQIELNFFIFGGLTSWFFGLIMFLKQLIGKLLLCSVRHIMVNFLGNADCWKVSPLSGTWCDLCFVNTGASHMEPRKLEKPIDYSSEMCMGNLNSQYALHVELAKQLFITIFIPVVEHTPTLSHSMFLFYFPCLFTILFIYGQTDFLIFSLQWMKWLQWQQF